MSETKDCCLRFSLCSILFIVVDGLDVILRLLGLEVWVVLEGERF